MDQEKLEKWRKLCQETVDYTKTMPEGSVARYATSYAQAGLNMCDADEISMQAIYIANNIKHVKGPKGKDLRARLREFY